MTSRLADEFPEINPSNYNDDDVCALNAWGIRAFDALNRIAKGDWCPWFINGNDESLRLCKWCECVDYHESTKKPEHEPDCPARVADEGVQP